VASPTAVNQLDDLTEELGGAIIGPRFWGEGAMAQTVCVAPTTAEREQLAANVADHNRPPMHAKRAQSARLG
jgi:hypothetical protein